MAALSVSVSRDKSHSTKALVTAASCLGCDLLVTVISAVLSSGDGENGRGDPSVDPTHRGDPEPFPFLSICPQHCYSVTQMSLAVALLAVTCPLDMLSVGCVSVVMSLKPYGFSVFKTATFVSIPYSLLHI